MAIKKSVASVRTSNIIPTSFPKKTSSLDKFKLKIPEKHYFVLCTGEKIQGVKELAEAFTKMDDGTFCYHVTQDRNDFANWIRDIFKDNALEKKVRNAGSRINAGLEIYRYIAEQVW